MRVLLFIISFALCSGLSGQSDRWLSMRASTGFFMPHRVSLPQLLTDKASAFELSYSARVNGEKDWHHNFLGPEKGIGVFVLDMGNTEELGNLYSVYPYLDLPLNKQGPSRLMLHMGVGIAYLNKKYDFEENFFNTAIGSHINYSIVLGLKYRYELDRFCLGTGVSIAHASNAAIQLPNLGVNIASADLSIGYRLNGVKSAFEVNPLRQRDRGDYFELSLSGGMRESNPVTREKHGVQEIRGINNREFSQKLSYQAGFDIIHNKASYQERTDIPEFGVDVIQTGLKIGVGLDFGNSQIYFQNGFYLTQGLQEQGFVYHRFGGKWLISERYCLDLSLKTHFAKADYLALGFGYLFSNRNLDKDVRPGDIRQ